MQYLLPASAGIDTVSAGHAQVLSPTSHFLLKQSASALQPFSKPHFTGQLPPQSTSVSVPFVTPSSHVGTWQSSSMQTPLLQSWAVTHAFVSAHGAQLPPQSTSVSSSFCTPSLH